MAVQLNHTIVHAKDKRESATFFTEIFGSPTVKFAIVRPRCSTRPFTERGSLIIDTTGRARHQAAACLSGEPPDHHAQIANRGPQVGGMTVHLIAEARTLLRAGDRARPSVGAPALVVVGQARGRSLEESLRIGSVAAAEVISHFGARPEADLKQLVTL